MPNTRAIYSKPHAVSISLQGAYAGLFTSLAFMFWIGIGAQVVKPPIPKARISVDGCNWNLTTTAATVTPFLNSTMTTVTEAVTNSTMALANSTTVETVTKSALEIAQDK